MFRRTWSSLPKDFEFPATFEGLGYCINEKDQIRSIQDPEQEFHYFISKNERYVEMQREAMNSCIRREVLSRLLALSMQITRLPLGASAEENHVPVLTSKNIATAKRVTVYIGESAQDLGIFAYRMIRHDTITVGSAVEFVQNVKSSARDSPALVIANMGQLIWHRRGKQAMSQNSWYAIPRDSAVSQPVKMDHVKNRVPQNEGLQEHVACVFKQVVDQMTDPDAEFYVIGVGDGALEVVEYLQEDWKKWDGRVKAIVVGASHIWRVEINDKTFGDFWGRRGRAYMISPEPVGTPLTGRKDFGCNCYSSGEGLYLECVMSKAHTSMLNYFKVLADNPHYEAEPQNISEVDNGENGEENAEAGES